MNLVAVESVEGPTVDALRQAGHSVLFIAEASPGIEDSEVLAIARRDQAILLTADKDFGELVFRSRLPHCGVLLIRPAADENSDQTAANTLAAISQHGSELPDRFSVLPGGALRIRITAA